MATDWLAALTGGGLTVAATVADAYEKEASPARVAFTRTGLTDKPFTVFLRRMAATEPAVGSASAADFRLEDGAANPVTDRLVIPAGQAGTELVVPPLPDTLAEVPEVARWQVGGLPSPATVRICDAAPVDANQRLLVAYLFTQTGR